MQTKVITLDVYGTILAIDDHDNELPSRKGFKDLVSRAQERNITLVTSSDGDLIFLHAHLEEALEKIGLKPEIFNHFFQLRMKPKDYSEIIYHYGVQPSQLLVIGDNYKNDITGAERLGCQVLHVPQYTVKEDGSDFSLLKLI